MQWKFVKVIGPLKQVNRKNDLQVEPRSCRLTLQGENLVSWRRYLGGHVMNGEGHESLGKIG